MIIYLDYAATTPIDKEIVDTYYELLNKYFANTASNHLLGGVVFSLQNRARAQIASYFHATAEEVIFTSGASESNNLAIKGVAFQYLNRGRHLITSKAEHPSVLNTFRQLEEMFGFSVTYLDVDSSGKVNLDQLAAALTPQTILVSIMAVNNEVGSINDIGKIAKIIKSRSRAFFHCDMTQAIGKIHTDLISPDLISCSAHKIYGLKGSGLLIKRKSVELKPQICGGNHEFGYRSGTSNWPVNVTLAKTIRLAFEHQDEGYEHVRLINDMVRKALINHPLVVINSPVDASPYILNLSIRSKKAAVVVQGLEAAGICVSTLSACSSKLDKPSEVVLNMFGDYERAISTIRLSFSKHTTPEEINRFIETINRVIDAVK